jgi:hypothetical protein
MLLNSELIELLAAFEKFKVRYLVIGGYAVGHHAEPRYTKDLDVWIGTDRKNSYALYRALAEYGAPLNGGPDMFEDEDSIYWFGFPPNRVDILMAPEGAPLFKDAWRRRVKAVVEGVNVTVVSKQDLIALKQLADRPVDRRDIKALRAAEKAVTAAESKSAPAAKKSTPQKKNKKAKSASRKSAR